MANYRLGLSSSILETRKPAKGILHACVELYDLCLTIARKEFRGDLLWDSPAAARATGERHLAQKTNISVATPLVNMHTSNNAI